MREGVRQGRRAGLLALAAALLWSSAGCGPTCADIARRRSLLLASRRPAKQPGWHLAVELPLDSLNGFIAGRLAEIPSVRVPLHLPGGLALGLATPPYGVCLFSICQITGSPYDKVVKEAVPFYISIATALLCITFIPEITLGFVRLIGM